MFNNNYYFDNFHIYKNFLKKIMVVNIFNGDTFRTALISEFENGQTALRTGCLRCDKYN